MKELMSDLRLDKIVPEDILSKTGNNIACGRPGNGPDRQAVFSENR
jgi:hypothetical protein